MAFSGLARSVTLTLALSVVPAALPSSPGHVSWTGIVAYALGETPDGEQRTRHRRVRPRRRAERVPEEFLEISSRWAVTRAELAVLLGVGLGRVLDRAAENRVVILTDTRDHWADSWIQTTARAGVMRASPTHEFEPDTLVRRHELATAIAAVLDLAVEHNPSLARLWQRTAPPFRDMEPTHVSYDAARTAVSAGLLELQRDGSFNPTATVGGAEAVDAVRRLERLTRG